MRSLKTRLGKLEAATHGNASPAVRRWLGWPLTDAETIEADLEMRKPLDLHEIQSSDLPKDAKQWLLGT